MTNETILVPVSYCRRPDRMRARPILHLNEPQTWLADSAVDAAAFDTADERTGGYRGSPTNDGRARGLAPDGGGGVGAPRPPGAQERRMPARTMRGGTF
jgi:hypothetical protein